MIITGLILCYIIINWVMFGRQCSIKHKWIEESEYGRTGGIGFIITYKCIKCNSTKSIKETSF